MIWTGNVISRHLTSFLSIWRAKKREVGREIYKEIFYLLVHSPNAYNSPDWAKPRSETQSWSSIWLAETQGFEPLDAMFQGALQLKSSRHSNMVCRHLYCYTNTCPMSTNLKETKNYFHKQFFIQVSRVNSFIITKNEK